MLLGKSSPRVSVLVSVLNCEKFIVETIESILSQTFTDFEFIIFDDGSTDRTAEIIKRYARTDNRMKPFFKAKNEGYEGMVANLNKGLDMAKGDYIARTDGDDISLPERFSKQVEFLDANPQIFLVGTGAININERGKHLRTFKPILDPELLRARLEKVGSIYNPSVMFRNSSEFRYIPLRICEDYNFQLQAVKRGYKVANLPQPLIKYRILRSSVSHSDPFLRLRNTVVAQEMFFNRLKQGEVNEDVLGPRYNATNCSKNILYRMVEQAYLGRGYDVIWRVALLYTKRFGFNLKVAYWVVICEIRSLAKKVLEFTS